MNEEQLKEWLKKHAKNSDKTMDILAREFCQDHKIQYEEHMDKIVYEAVVDLTIDGAI